MIVFRRELRTLVTSPQAWAIATAYLIISGLFFVTLLFSHPYADLERYYSNIETTLIVVAPIMAMRSFAEERRTGALDITLSWPVSRWPARPRTSPRAGSAPRNGRRSASR